MKIKKFSEFISEGILTKFKRSLNSATEYQNKQDAWNKLQSYLIKLKIREDNSYSGYGHRFIGKMGKVLQYQLKM